MTAQRADCCKSNSVGKPIKGVEVKIVGDDGEPVKQDERGIIHINTQSRFNGYMSCTTKHESIYMDWLNSGDIGYFDENDELHIVDRVDDVIIIDSHKVYPSEVEWQIANYTAISECVIIKLEYNDNEFIGSLYTGQREIDDNVKEKLLKVLMPYEIPRLFIKNNDIPKTLNGKISKNEVYSILMKELGKEIEK